MHPSRDTSFTRDTPQAMGSADAGRIPVVLQVKPGHTCDRQRTTPKCSCVNWRACGRNNKRLQINLSCICDGIPANNRKTRRWRTAWELFSQSNESQNIEVLPPAEGAVRKVLPLSPKCISRNYGYQKKCVDKDEVVGLVGPDWGGEFQRRGLAGNLPNEPCSFGYICSELQCQLLQQNTTMKQAIIVEKRVAGCDSVGISYQQWQQINWSPVWNF